MIDDELKIGDEKITTDAALMAAQQVAERQRELAGELRKKAAVAHQNATDADRQSEKAEDGGPDKAENDKLAGSKGETVDTGEDVPGAKTTSDTDKEAAPAPTRGSTIVDLNA